MGVFYPSYGLKDCGARGYRGYSMGRLLQFLSLASLRRPTPDMMTPALMSSFMTISRRDDRRSLLGFSLATMTLLDFPVLKRYLVFKA